MISRIMIDAFITKIYFCEIRRSFWGTGFQTKSSVSLSFRYLRNAISCADPEGDMGSEPPPLKNHKNIGFLSNTGPDPL